MRRSTGGGGRHKTTGEREKTRIKGSGEEFLGQPINMMRGQTVWAPVTIIEIDRPGAGMVLKRRRRLGF